MKEAKLPVPEIGAIAVTRAMLGAGLGLLLAGRLAPRRRQAVGATLMAVGILTTVPLALDLVRRIRD